MAAGGGQPGLPPFQLVTVGREGDFPEVRKIKDYYLLPECRGPEDRHAVYGSREVRGESACRGDPTT
jgi:hypothetical protein